MLAIRARHGGIGLQRLFRTTAVQPMDAAALDHRLREEFGTASAISAMGQRRNRRGPYSFVTARYDDGARPAAAPKPETPDHHGPLDEPAARRWRRGGVRCSPPPRRRRPAAAPAPVRPPGGGRLRAGGPRDGVGADRRGARERRADAALATGTGGGGGEPAATGFFSTSGNFIVRDDWDTGFVADITVTNAGDEAVGGWPLLLEMPNDIVNIWNAEITDDRGDAYVIENADWNGGLAPGATATLGFQGTGDIDLSAVGYTHGGRLRGAGGAGGVLLAFVR